MLNKPKFMSPSTNMQNYTIDLNSDNIEFSCIVDGNEMITAWRILIYDLETNDKLLDTNRIDLDTPFFPIDEKNRNVLFKINLKDYLENSLVYFSATSTYDSEITYYTRSGSEGNYTYTEYTYSSSTWDSDYRNLFYTKLKNSTKAYYWTIQFYTDLSSVTSCEEVFYANSYPVVELFYSENNSTFTNSLTDNIVLNSSKYYFKATYKQAENIGLKRYGWRIKDSDNNAMLLDTISKNQIYGTAQNIICYYDGFLNGGNYSIELYVETQNNVVVFTTPISFSMKYETTYLENVFKTEILYNESGILLDWGDSSLITGVEYGDVKYIDNFPINLSTTSVYLGEDENITFNSDGISDLDIDEDCYIVLSTQLYNNKERVVFSAEGIDETGYDIMRHLYFDGSKFIYTIVDSNGTVKIEQPISIAPSQTSWYIITMSPFLGENGVDSSLTVVEDKTNNGLYPSIELYPKTDLYPSFGTWNKLKEG